MLDTGSPQKAEPETGIHMKVIYIGKGSQGGGMGDSGEGRRGEEKEGRKENA